MTNPPCSSFSSPPTAPHAWVVVACVASPSGRSRPGPGKSMGGKTCSGNMAIQTLSIIKYDITVHAVYNIIMYIVISYHIPKPWEKKWCF